MSCQRRALIAAAGLVALVVGCAGPESTAIPRAGPANGQSASSLESRVRSLAITVPGDTAFGPSSPVQLRVIAWDAKGAPIEGIVARWAVSDTALATISSDGELRVGGTGGVTVSVTAGVVEQRVSIPVIAVDLAAAHDVLSDAYVARVMSAISGSVGDDARVALAQATAALAAGDVALLRRRTGGLREALRTAATTPDRALAVILELYVDRLGRALQLPNTEE